MGEKIRPLNPSEDTQEYLLDAGQRLARQEAAKRGGFRDVRPADPKEDTNPGTLLAKEKLEERKKKKRW